MNSLTSNDVPGTMPKPFLPAAADEFWTIKHLCAYLKLGKTSIWDGVRRGRIPKPVRIGGSTRWKRSTIEAWEQTLS
ncbi:helix-turn-helix transcriptional regulator [Acidimangrovimonas sediminis]|uniref:helix-turn-helix transcriptional regulator n=1 Tax=Acidimangrovimonas sediminis TaxID=2056283 RepID=UPI001304E59B|nr:helix-turn-helix domain-containing protein [Acidimangrovimonas sediminis]